MVQQAYKGKNPRRRQAARGSRRPGNPPAMDAEQLAYRNLGSRRKERTLADVTPDDPARRPQAERPKPTEFYLGRVVMGSKSITRDLVSTFPGLELIHPSGRLTLPLMQKPDRPMHEKQAKSKSDRITRALPSLRNHLEAVPIEDPAWFVVDGEISLVHIRLAEPEEGNLQPWQEQLAQDVLAVREQVGGAGLKQPPDAIPIATASDKTLAAEAANYLSDSGVFSEGTVTLSGLQICPVPVLGTES